MPGPVSDSYDPEFGTGAAAHEVNSGMQKIVDRIAKLLGPKLKNIVDVAEGESGAQVELRFTERELRLIRFGLTRAMESI